MVLKLKKPNGFTLTEILVASTLLGIVVLAISSIYIAGTRSMASAQTSVSQAGIYVVFEHIARNVARAGEIQVTESDDEKQANLRLITGTSDESDDDWAKYLIDTVSGKVYYVRVPAAQAADPVPKNDETDLEPRLSLDDASAFTKLDGRTLRIVLVSTMGLPAKTVTLSRDATSYAVAP